METPEPLNHREEIVGRWALRPPQCEGTITYFVWLLRDATVLWSDTYNAYEGGHLERETTESLFRMGVLWNDPYTSIILRQFSVPVVLTSTTQSKVLLLNGLGVFGEEDAGKLDPDQLVVPGIILDALTMDELLDAEIKPQIERILADFKEVEEQPIAILPSSKRTEVRATNVASSKIVGRWWLGLNRSACPAQYGIFIRENGTVTFWDLFTQALTVEASPLDWFKRFDRWQTIEEIPGWEADQVSKYTRTIKLYRKLVLDILRLNRKGMCCLERRLSSLASNTNLHLENVYWRDIARYLPYQPRHRASPQEKMKLTPGPGDVIRNDPTLP